MFSCPFDTRPPLHHGSPRTPIKVLLAKVKRSYNEGVSGLKGDVSDPAELLKSFFQVPASYSSADATNVDLRVFR